MTRLAAIMLFLTVVAAATRTDAQEPYKAWWAYLKGEWTYQIADMKGTATYRQSAKRNALVGRFEREDGTIGTELSGWRSDTESLYITGFGSDGGFWQLDLDKLKKDSGEGSHQIVFGDGGTFKGHFVLKRVDDNRFEWVSKGTDGEGQEVIRTGKFVRKTEEKK